MQIEVSGQSVYLYTGGKKLTPDTVDRNKTVVLNKPVVFIHGAQQDHSCWTLQTRWFAHHGFSVLAPDLPGHGRSGGEPLASIEAIADWVAALLDTLGVEKADIVGHSMGSLVALEFSVRHPQRVARSVLIGTALPMPVADVLLNAARDNEPKAAAMINAWSYSSSGQIGGNTVPGLWLLGVNQRLMARQKRGVFHVDLAACNAYQRPLDSLSAITAPTLLIAGSQDKMTSPKVAKAVQAAIPGARLVIVDGSGHALMAERPDAVLDALIGFLAKT
ncbi:MAG: alpha/beta hydrolase [Betaproteobacteria bacterium HGW-Betaproteobacteria-10]|nr:MAG: alpha/beta hydrolase [Betaproteobacteria bacterium HGW-Betaproteobacteria-10]